MNSDVLVTWNEKEPLEPRLVRVKGTLVISPGLRDTLVLFGLALSDTISGTRLTEQVPMFPTRSSPTKTTLGLQQLDVKYAGTNVFFVPWLNALTEAKQIKDKRL